MPTKLVVTDEDLLWAVRARTEGWSTVQIARELGVSDSYARVVTSKVRAADIAEIGEPRETVEAAYWAQGVPGQTLKVS